MGHFVEKTGLVKILCVQQIVPVVRNLPDVVKALPLSQLVVFKSQVDVVLEQSGLLFLIHHLSRKTRPELLGQLHNDWSLRKIQPF